MLRPNLNKLKSIHWYRQGGAIKLFYGFGIYHCAGETLGYDHWAIHQKGEVNMGFFDRDEERRKALWVIAQQKRDRRFIYHWIAEWRRRKDTILSYCRDAFREPVTTWNDKKLIRFLCKINRFLLHHWMKGFLIEWFDPEGDLLLQEEIRKSGIAIPPDALVVLTAPEKLTFVQEEYIARVALARRLQQGASIDRALKHHVKKYHSYEDNWAYVHEHGRDHFEKLVRRESKNLSVALKEVREIRDRFRRTKKQKRELLRSLRIPRSLANVLHLFSVMTDWRDERKKESVFVINHYLYQILKRLMQENHLQEQVAGQLLYTQITGWKLPRTVIAEAEKRNRGALYLCNADREYQWFYGKKAQHLFQTLLNTMKRNEVKGVTASKGKAIGRVRIIEAHSDFPKMQKDDVLVATMTRPEYMPLIKKAAAIVTNEGGLTCHAAIVSRELGIPCIIGTQVATEVLKDGDRVEVDATNGIVRKL